MKRLFLPPNNYQFPHIDYGIQHHQGLVGIGQDLDIERLLAAYRLGVFPWFEENGWFYWFATSPRTVLLPEKLHISKSLAKTLRNKSYRITVNQHFAQVIAACANASRPNQAGTWIAPPFQTAYTRLHQLGFAHSFECHFPDKTLAGGFYGVQIGSVFYGESMFAHAPNASKIAFAHAIPFLAQCGIQLIDCQQDTDHLKRFGSQIIDFQDFQTALKQLNAIELKQTISAQILCEQYWT